MGYQKMKKRFTTSLLLSFFVVPYSIVSGLTEVLEQSIYTVRDKNASKINNAEKILANNNDNDKGLEPANTNNIRRVLFNDYDNNEDFELVQNEGLKQILIKSNDNDEDVELVNNNDIKQISFNDDDHNENFELVENENVRQILINNHDNDDDLESINNDVKQLLVKDNNDEMLLLKNYEHEPKKVKKTTAIFKKNKVEQLLNKLDSTAAIMNDDTFIHHFGFDKRFFLKLLGVYYLETIDHVQMYDSLEAVEPLISTLSDEGIRLLKKILNRVKMGKLFEKFSLQKETEKSLVSQNAETDLPLTQSSLQKTFAHLLVSNCALRGLLGSGISFLTRFVMEYMGSRILPNYYLNDFRYNTLTMTLFGAAKGLLYPSEKCGEYAGSKMQEFVFVGGSLTSFLMQVFSFIKNVDTCDRDFYLGIQRGPILFGKNNSFSCCGNQWRIDFIKHICFDAISSIISSSAIYSIMNRLANLGGYKAPKTYNEIRSIKIYNWICDLDRCCQKTGA